MGAEKSKLIKETGYAQNPVNAYEEVYKTVLHQQREKFTAATMHMRCRLNLDFCIAFVRALDKDKDGHLSFPELVWGMFDVGPATIDEKIECLIRFMDIDGDGFITQDDCNQLNEDCGTELDLEALEDYVIDLNEDLHNKVKEPLLNVKTWEFEKDIEINEDNENDEDKKQKKLSKEEKLKQKEQEKRTATLEKSIRVRSARNRLAIALPLLRRCKALPGATLQDVQTLILNEFFAECGEDRLLPLCDDKQFELRTGRSTKKSSKTSLDVPDALEKPRARSRSPLRNLLKNKEEMPIAPGSPQIDDNSNQVLILKRGASIDALRTQCRQHRELLFFILHLRDFSQQKLLPVKNSRAHRRDPYDSYYASTYAYHRTPIVIDLQNINKTQREISRRKKNEEERQKSRAKHLEKQLDAMRKQSNGGKKKKDSSNLSILRQR